ncbi:hypothetical protein H6P81_014633 [Aristolochia fimbriata]|uniref:Signal recognition particle subunit SRP68 n=1 Tax=Aristolochia fimbriata TaxID=158543 RepID=A0AAV7E3Y9_ARIFI|nr:hypothetical protein H6P81_014633 [Aristolochia fimbriata]
MQKHRLQSLKDYLTYFSIGSSCKKAQQLERNIFNNAGESLSAEKKLVQFDKIFAAYHNARSCIRNDLVTAGEADNVKDDLSGLDKAISNVLSMCTVERNQLLISSAKSKLAKHRDEKSEKVTKPEELVRLYDLLIQSTADLCDLVNSGRDRTPEEVAFAEEYTIKSLAFRAERCFYLAKSYSLAGIRTEAYVLYCHAGSLADQVVHGLQSANNFDQELVQELKALSINSRSNSCIEHAAGIAEEEKTQEKLTKGVSKISLKGVEKAEKFLLDNLDNYVSAVGDPNSKGIARITSFPPAFQAVPCNPIVLDVAFNSIDFPSLEDRMKKDKKGIFSRLWGS